MIFLILINEPDVSKKTKFMLFLADTYGVSLMTHQFDSYYSGMTHFVLKTTHSFIERIYKALSVHD